MPDFRTSSLPVAFDAGQLTSDGGVVWLAQADDHLGLSAAFAAQVRDWRRGPARHSLALLVRQRILQIACGYEDQDDADTLRRDPLLKLVCGRRPHEPTTDLASQPTLSRLENAVDRRACYRLAQALLAIYLQERERVAGQAPTHVLLDLDSTADPTHGEQEGSSYHGYYRQHMYHPLLVFDGDTNQLITAVLRQGTAHASQGVVAILTILKRLVVAILKRLVVALRTRWPHVAIALRADSGFAIPALYAYCEHEQIAYTIGLAPNARLVILRAILHHEMTAKAHHAITAKVHHMADRRE
jgi:Transposase DDE domain group 1